MKKDSYTAWDKVQTGWCEIFSNVERWDCDLRMLKINTKCLYSAAEILDRYCPKCVLDIIFNGDELADFTLDLINKLTLKNDYPRQVFQQIFVDYYTDELVELIEICCIDDDLMRTNHDDTHDNQVYD